MTACARHGRQDSACSNSRPIANEMKRPPDHVDHHATQATSIGSVSAFKGTVLKRRVPTAIAKLSRRPIRSKMSFPDKDLQENRSHDHA